MVEYVKAWGNVFVQAVISADMLLKKNLAGPPLHPPLPLLKNTDCISFRAIGNSREVLSYVRTNNLTAERDVRQRKKKRRSESELFVWIFSSVFCQVNFSAQNREKGI